MPRHRYARCFDRCQIVVADNRDDVKSVILLIGQGVEGFLQSSLRLVRRHEQGKRMRYRLRSQRRPRALYPAHSPPRGESRAQFHDHYDGQHDNDHGENSKPDPVAALPTAHVTVESRSGNTGPSGGTLCGQERAVGRYRRRHLRNRAHQWRRCDIWLGNAGLGSAGPGNAGLGASEEQSVSVSGSPKTYPLHDFLHKFSVALR